jgi:Helix-turn-helix family
MWALYEPVHVVTYFAAQARDALTAAGLRGFWRGYFAGRAAPLGAVPAAPVLASFFSFAPSMVTRALPEVWAMAAPEVTLRARADGAVAALEVLLTGVPGPDVTEAVTLLEEATAALQPAGRVLGAANLALPVNEHPLARLWQACTTLREHRGDGHNAALVAVALGPVDVLALRCGLDLNRSTVQPARGWTDQEWAAAQGRLMERGWLDGQGSITTDGRDAVQALEDATDLANAAPWDALGPAATQRLAGLLAPMARACTAIVPAGNPIGLAAGPS